MTEQPHESASEIVAMNNDPNKQRLARLEKVISFLATADDGWPLIEEIGMADIHWELAGLMPDEWEPDGNPVDVENMTEAFIRMVENAEHIESLKKGKQDDESDIAKRFR